MAIFSAGTVTTTAVANTATKIFDTTLSKWATGVTLKDVTVVNTGTVTIFLGQSAVTAVTGLALQAGAQVTYNGYSHAKSDTTGDIYAITASGTGAAQTGLITVAAND